jgi:hypothetical protein
MNVAMYDAEEIDENCSKKKEGSCLVMRLLKLTKHIWN